MGDFFEKCHEIATSKAARIIWALAMIAICVFGVMRLMQASNDMNEKNLQKHLQLVLEPEGGIFDFHGEDEKNVEEWSTKLNEFFDPYRIPNPNRVDCDFANPPPAGKSCNVKINRFGLCQRENYYGISRNMPCFFLKLNSEDSWNPKAYNSSDLPKEMPEDLQDAIKKYNQKTLWVSCEGENPIDKENLGPIEYIPDRAFNNYGVSTKNEGYLAPVIAVRFQKPEVGILMTVKCTLWIPGDSTSVSFMFRVAP